MSINLSIVLKRASKVYHEGETIVGVVVVECGTEARHEGLSLLAEGAAALQLPARAAQGLLDAFTNNIKPIPLLNTTVELAAAGRLPAGTTEIPFEVPLRSRSRLLETYHGVFVNVTYALKCSLKRSFLNKPVHTSCQFFMQYVPQDTCVVKPVRCEITPASVRAAGGAGGGRRSLPHFQMYAELASTVCALDRPLTGKIRVEECAAGIKSVELQLVRVETCGGAEGCSRDVDEKCGLARILPLTSLRLPVPDCPVTRATEIQNIQVCDGEVMRGRDIPLHVVLPRLFTCPTTATPHFKIEFELNIAVIFEDDYLVTENFPILLVRSK